MSDNLPRPSDWEEELRRYFNIRVWRLMKQLEEKDSPTVLRQHNMIEDQCDLIGELRNQVDLQEEVNRHLLEDLNTLKNRIDWLEGNSRG